MSEPLLRPLAIGGLVHHDADAGALEGFRFSDEAALLEDARGAFGGALLLQTCNRVELLVPATGAELAEYLHASGRDGFTLREGEGAVSHLLEVACGLDSMIMGEDQILGQLRQALVLSRGADALDPFLEECVNAAIHLGRPARAIWSLYTGRCRSTRAGGRLWPTPSQSCDHLECRKITVLRQRSLDTACAHNHFFRRK
jgi:glutamyl-tRNA reductase